MTTITRSAGLLAIAIAVLAACQTSLGSENEANISFYRLRSPGHQYDIEQASGLHFGQLGTRQGLWLVCDRNAGRSAGQIFFIASETLKRAKHRETITADEAITVLPPKGDWSAFADRHPQVGKDVLAELYSRLHPGPDQPANHRLDLEALTIAPSPTPPHEPHVFVVTEEPYSTVLELAIEKTDPPRREAPAAIARLTAVFTYHEKPDEHGIDHNDGLEGLAWAGQAGRFFWAEEGTRIHHPNAHPRLFFLDPRIGLAQLKPGRVLVDQPASDALTVAVRAQRQGDMQTLNGLAVTQFRHLLAVDRNGGWILRIDPKTRSADRWLNLYDLEGKNLRELLAEFPYPRQMPYISIEGIAIDDSDAIWLVDDPAMPEAFRASCLIRITGLAVRKQTNPKPPLRKQ